MENKEDINIIWSENINENIQYTINAWLNLLEEEKNNRQKSNSAKRSNERK